MVRQTETTMPHLLRVKTVRGEPYTFTGKTLTPVARVVGLGKAQGTLRTHSVSGWGAGFALVTPRAVLLDTEHGQRRIPIRDATTSALCGILAAALFITILCTALRWLAGRRIAAGSPPATDL